jgi:hypothetical protein
LGRIGAAGVFFYPPLPGLLTEDPELLLPEEELPLLLLLDDGV